jgi:hypothetical protein
VQHEGEEHHGGRVALAGASAHSGGWVASDLRTKRRQVA